MSKKPFINYCQIDTKIFSNKTIGLDLKNATETISSWVMNTRDEATRQALIALGWTPPKEHKKANE